MSPSDLVAQVREHADKPASLAKALGDNQVMVIGDDRVGSEAVDLVVDQIGSLRDAGVHRLVIACPPDHSGERQALLEALNRHQDLDVSELDNALGTGQTSWLDAALAAA